MVTNCNRAIGSAVQNHTPELARKCTGGTSSGIAHPEVLPDPDIRGKDAENAEEGEPEKGEVLKWKEGEGTEPEVARSTETEERQEKELKEEGCAESEERRGNLAIRGSRKGNLKVSTETYGRHDQRRHVPGGAWLAQVRSCLRVDFLPKWLQGGSEKGTQKRDREEGIGKRELCQSSYLP
ncbi:hypothetical protein NDU88_005462 [Pleurodeles waltl]|uniref:Uncharacterized protein n=1 Tax=Pleurodeles waltl TaxID=8319 RepID=A0AAV7NQC5_PLEWA|nr:hypothetical protein NDU88_005462 [Pleurodeles waltl]